MGISNWSKVAADNDDADLANGIDWREGQLPSTVNGSARAMMAGIREHYDATIDILAGTQSLAGTATAYTLTLAGSPATLANGFTFQAKANVTCTGGATSLVVTPAGGAAFSSKNIKMIVEGAEANPVAGSIVVGGHYTFVYDSAADGATGAYILVNPTNTPRKNLSGGITGLHLSNNGTDANNDIDIAAGSARDSTNAYDLTLASSLTKQLDAAWAVGTNQGGLDTGSKANSTGYHVYLIRKDSDGTIDALFSTSATSPTLPSGWSVKRRIGSFMTNASGNIRSFVQSGQWFQFKDTPPSDASALVLSATTLQALSLPLGVKYEAVLSFVTSGAAGWLVIRDPDVGSPSTADATTGIWYRPASGSAGMTLRCFTDSSRQVYLKDEITSATISLSVRAYRDHRDEYL